MTFTCIHGIWSKWAPPLERSVLGTISFSGLFAGMVLAMPLSGVITQHWHWSGVFYVFGVFGVVWSIFWFALVTDSPENHPTISQKEKDYIVSSLAKEEKTTTKPSPPPWSKMLKSPAVWAIAIAHTTDNFGRYTLLTQMPIYLKRVLKFSIQDSGILSALPYVCLVFIIQFSGRLADYLRKGGHLSTVSVRKCFNTIGFLSQAIFLAVVGYTTDKNIAIFGFTFAVGIGGFVWSGYGVNHLDIAPKVRWYFTWIQ